jgi:hypothetical protein
MSRREEDRPAEQNTRRLEELERFVLTVDVQEHGLEAGDSGTVVLRHEPEGYEGEFTYLTGGTRAVVSLHEDQVRPAQEGEVARAVPAEAGTQ